MMSVESVLRVFRENRLVLTVWSLVGLSLGVGYAVFAPSWYEAQLAVVPTNSGKSPGGIAGALASELPIDLSLGTGGSDADRIQAVLKSRSVTDAVIAKFHLEKRYNKHFIESARRSLWTHCSTKLDKKPSVVTLTCEDTDPATVAEMVGYFGEIGNAVFRRISTSSATEERKFLELRVIEAKKDVISASQKLREFQEEHKLIDLPEQSKAVVSAMAALKGEMLSKELQLSYLSSFSSSEEVTETQLRRQVAAIQNKLKTLEENTPRDADDKGRSANSGARNAKDANMFPAAMSVPRLRFELEQLYREQKIAETVFLLVTQRFELAKVNEARDTSAFQILDPASIPTRPSRPSRLSALCASVIAGPCAAILFAAWLARRRQTIAS